MGTKQLIILFITCFLATSCTREVVVSPGGNTEGKVPVSLSIIFDHTTNTRDAWEYDEYFPEITADEKKVSNIMLVIFKNEVLEQYSYFDEGDFQQDKQNDYSISLEDKEGEDLLELEPGPHYFYAILNIPDEEKTTLISTLSGKEGQMTRTNFERLIIERSLDEMTDHEGHFIMTNSNPPSIRGIYSDEQIKENNELSNHVYISVGRAVGKISFVYVASEVQTGELHGKLENIRYKILHNPPSIYMMPVMENKILLTPHFYSNSVAGTFKPSTKDANILDGEWLTATTPATKKAGQELDYGYCMENNNNSPLRSTSTMLLIEAQFVPAVWLNADGTKGESSPDGTFYRIGCYNTKGVLYAYEQGYYNTRPSDEVMNKYKKGADAASVYDIAEYKNGITYYGFWPKQNDQYMVKRNNYYKIAITHIHGAGVPDPDDVVDPDIDPEDPKTYGRLGVYAVTWIEEQVEISIGNEPVDDSWTNVGTDPGVKDWEDKEQEEELKEGDENRFN